MYESLIIIRNWHKYFHLELKKYKFVAPLVKLLFELKFSHRYSGACSWKMLNTWFILNWQTLSVTESIFTLTKISQFILLLGPRSRTNLTTLFYTTCNFSIPINIKNISNKPAFKSAVKNYLKITARNRELDDFSYDFKILCV
jgi:hypothetical protein